MEISVKILKKLKIDLPYDPAIPLPSVCPKYLVSYYTDICSAMLTVARKWK